MLENFFIDGTSPPNAEQGTYDLWLVLASYIVASLASYAGLTFAAQLFNAKTERERKTLHLTGAFALGIGIWLMHFIGMLAYKMRVPAHYDPWLTGMSMLIAIMAAFFAFQLTKNATLSPMRLGCGAVLLGTGIAGMHYTDMAAMNMMASLRYIPWLFFLSVAIAIATSGAALWIMFTFGHRKEKRWIIGRITAALTMGAAICGMHYTGMAAAVIVPSANYHLVPTGPFDTLAVAVLAGTAIIFLLLTLIISRRLMLIVSCSTIFALPLTVIVYQAVTELNANLATVRKEEYGIKYLDRVVDLLQRTQEARTITYIIRNGDRTFDEKLPPTKEAARQLTVVIDRLDDAYGTELASTRQWEKLKTDTLSLFDTPDPGSPLEEFKKYSDTIDSMTDFIADIADNSDLNTDPSLATNYLADANTNVVPRIMGTIGKTRGLMAGLLAAGKPPSQWTEPQRRELQTLYYALITQDGDLENTLERAQKADQNASPYIEFQQRVIRPALEDLQNHFENMIFLRADDWTTAEIYAHSSQVIDLYDQLYDKTTASFLNLSQQRHGEYTTERNLVLYSSIIASFGFIGLFLFLYRTLARTERTEKTAAVANMAKSEFLANMSHELRTPLNSILGMNRLLLESGGLTAEQKGLTQTVFQSSVNLLEIVNDILDLSKIEAGEMKLERIGFDCKYVFQSVTDTLSQIAREKRLAILRSYESETLPYVLGDPTRFGRILINLIGNAIKYTDSGHVEIQAKCRRLKDNHIELHCEITDTGVGIAPNKLRAIFDKFVQADTSTTRKYGGTGLGLAITKQLVELMGGTIGVRSETGKGSTFWFTIPLETTDQLHEEKHVRRQKALLGTIPSEKARILVAEDHPFNQLLVRRILSKFGIGHSEIVDNGLDVLAAIQLSQWDIILMDCHMPGKNGYDTTLEIRELEKKTGRHTPIIAMTANAMIGDRDKCLRYGMDEYISKPLDIEGLKEILSQWIMFGKDTPMEAPRDAAEKNADIDFSLLESFSEGNPALVRELIQVFLEQSDENIKHLGEHLANGDIVKFHEMGHMLKGSASNTGAANLATLCHQAQHFHGTPQTQAALYRKITDEYALVTETLKKKYPPITE